MEKVWSYAHDSWAVFVDLTAVSVAALTAKCCACSATGKREGSQADCFLVQLHNLSFAQFFTQNELTQLRAILMQQRGAE